MRTLVLCLCFVNMVYAAPKNTVFSFPSGNLPPLVQNPMLNHPFPRFAQTPQQPVNAPVSMELVFVPKNPGQATGGWQSGATGQSQAFLKYSMPKSPGMKSVEVFYPIDYEQEKQIFAQYGFMPPAIPQNNPNMNPSYIMPQAGPQESPLYPNPAQGVQSSPNTKQVNSASPSNKELPAP